MLNSRKKRGKSTAPEFCRNCGRVIKYHRTEYCSDECRRRFEKREYQIAGINALRLAAIQQAKKDGALKRWIKQKSFYQLFPEFTPDQLRKGEEKK